MGHYLKDPDATLDYAIDWGARYLQAGESISASEWQVGPEVAGGLAIADSAIDGSVTSATVSGGKAGALYRLTNRITMSSGRTDERSISLRIGER